MESRKAKWARQTIERAIEQEGPYSHNICSMALMVVAKADGKEAANKLIKYYSLDALYRIQQVNV